MFILGFRSCLLQYYTLFYMASELLVHPQTFGINECLESLLICKKNCNL